MVSTNYVLSKTDPLYQDILNNPSLLDEPEIQAYLQSSPESRQLRWKITKGLIVAGSLVLAAGTLLELKQLLGVSLGSGGGVPSVDSKGTSANLKQSGFVQDIIKYGAMFSLTWTVSGVAQNLMSYTYDWIFDPDKTERENQESLFKDLKSQVFNKSYMTGLSNEAIRELWLLYQAVGSSLGVEVSNSQFPIYWFDERCDENDELDDMMADLDLQYKRNALKIQELQMKSYEKSLAEEQIGPYDYSYEQTSGRLEAQAEFEAGLPTAWDGLDDATRETLLANGISKERLNAYNAAVNSGLPQDKIDLLFPEFVESESLANTYEYDDLMQMILDSDNTAEDESQRDFYESEVTGEEYDFPEELYFLNTFRRRRY